MSCPKSRSWCTNHVACSRIVWAIRTLFLVAEREGTSAFFKRKKAEKKKEKKGKEKKKKKKYKSELGLEFITEAKLCCHDLGELLRAVLWAVDVPLKLVDEADLADSDVKLDDDPELFRLVSGHMRDELANLLLDRSCNQGRKAGVDLVVRANNLGKLIRSKQGFCDHASKKKNEARENESGWGKK